MTPLRQAWDLCYTIADRYQIRAWMEDGRVYLNDHCVFDTRSTPELNKARRDVLHGLIDAPGLCVTCGAKAVGIDLKRGVEVCEAHRP